MVTAKQQYAAVEGGWWSRHRMGVSVVIVNRVVAKGPRQMEGLRLPLVGSNGGGHGELKYCVSVFGSFSYIMKIRNDFQLTHS